MTSTRPETTFSTVISGHVCQHYTDDNHRLLNLYQLAVQKAWRVGDMPWQQTHDCTVSPFAMAHEPLRGFPDFDGLTADEKIRILWRLHGQEISDILYGEQAALLISSQLISSMPDMASKLFASSQVFDEARHVEFFSYYLHSTVGYVDPPSQQLRSVVDSMLEEHRWDFKLIACQVLIESIALARLQELRSVIAVPVMRHAIDYIMQDEARHVHFGSNTLKAHMTGLSSAEIQLRSDYVMELLFNLAGAMNTGLRIADEMNWNVIELRRHLRQRRAAQPVLRQGVFRQLRINLKAAGLLTQKTTNRLGMIEMGI